MDSKGCFADESAGRDPMKLAVIVLVRDREALFYRMLNSVLVTLPENAEVIALSVTRCIKDHFGTILVPRLG